jgi:hypothetical protein
MSETPTSEIYSFLQEAYNYFNTKLFNGALPHCLITLQREKGCSGYFSPERFINSKNKKTDEIALNPSVFAVQTIEDVLSTLVHEQVHLWQYHYGKPGRRGYHNREWGVKMKEVGLFPSSTGKEGGKETGESMTHYIIPGGMFDVVCASLVNKYLQIPWLDTRPPYISPTLLELIETFSNEESDNTEDKPVEPFVLPPEKKINKSNRVKYSCPYCKTSVWGKPDIRIVCGNPDCDHIEYEEVIKNV